ncbi:MAG: hypothetical protein ACRC50_03770 [Gaiella sp.]
MARERILLLGAVGAALAIGMLAGSALAARGYGDPTGDAGSGPDVRGVTISNTRRSVAFAVRFARTPPLSVSERAGWVDMLLIGLDLPPVGPAPVAPGGEWRGVDLVLGTHGPSETGVLVRVPSSPSEERRPTAIPVRVSGSTLRLVMPRAALRGASWFRFSIAAAREWGEGASEPAGARPDVVPDRGTSRYALTR